nr:hypothetical protein [Tanacetum cinerariifolium]
CYEREGDNEMVLRELRRSGRVKSKIPVVKENTASDAYSVDDESSGDDFVDGNGKVIKMGNQIAKRGSRSNVTHSSGAAKEKGESSKASTSKLKKEKGKAKLIGEMLGIKNKGVDITAKVNANNDEMVKD